LDKAKEELADIVIVALNLAGQMGFDMEYEVLRKMEINKKRMWSKPDSQGVIHHI
jgi:NTP pyrophosphatase (non-canonical NTP hydrolase)